jgi:hypothetical protein
MYLKEFLIKINATSTDSVISILKVMPFLSNKAEIFSPSPGDARALQVQSDSRRLDVMCLTSAWLQEGHIVQSFEISSARLRKVNAES